MPTTTTGIATEFINFSRASLATVTDADGRIKWAPHNLLSASEQFDASAWSKGATTVTANAVAAPNATTTADALFETIANTEHTVQQNLSSYNGTLPVRAGVYVRANGRTKGFLRFYNTISPFDGIQVDFDLTAVSHTGVAINGGTFVTSGIQDVGGGWFFVFGVGNGTATSSTYAVQYGTRNDAGSLSYVGDITKGFYLWGAHLYRSDLGMQANTSAYPMYNPTTARNLLGFSEDFSNASWFKTGSKVAANAVTAPNGLQTADKLTEDSSTGGHFVRQTLSTVGGTRYTLSFYAKAAERNWVAINAVNPAVSDNFTYFNLSGSGSVGTNDPDNTPAITSVGDGWYRCSITHTTQSSQTQILFIIYTANANNSFSYTGDDTSGVYLWGAQLSDSASLDPYVSSPFAAPVAGAYHGPRRDFDPSSLACRGLLVEEARTNLLTYSEAFDDAAWSKGGAATVTANTTAAPSGNATADTFTGASGDPDTTATDTIWRTVTVASSTSYTFSVYLYGLTGTTAKIVLRDASTGNIGTRTVTLTAAWQRATISLTSGAATTQFNVRIGGTNGTIAAWGAQLEAGSFATSYIPTGASSVTRSADVASVATSAFPYSASEGTLVVNVARQSGGGNNWAWGTDSIYNDVILGNTNVNHRYGQGGTVNLIVSGEQTSAKVAAAYTSGTGHAISVNGSAATTASSTAPNPNAATILYLGREGAASGPLNGHIRQITYIPRRLSNSDLQARTV